MPENRGARTEFAPDGSMRVYDDAGVLRLALGTLDPLHARIDGYADAWIGSGSPPTEIPAVSAPPPRPPPPTHRRLIFRKKD